MQIPEWSFSALRRKSEQSCSLVDELTCHCSLAPLAPERHLELVNELDFREITKFATENSSKYFLVKVIREQVMKHDTDAIVPDCQYQLCALLGHLTVQMGSGLGVGI